MNYTLFLQTSAVRDLQKAFDWYEEQRPGLGTEFIAETDRVFLLIESHPLQFAIIYKHKRRVVVRRFPYHIIYSVEGKIIRISAVIHGKRDPEKWQRRK